MAVDISYTLGSRGVARLKVKDTQADTATALRPTIDETLSIADGATVLFNGDILEVNDSAIIDPRRGVLTGVNATDHSSVCDGRIVMGKTYAVGQTRKQIVTDLYTSYLAVFPGISIDAGMSNGSALAAELTFENVTLTVAFQKISEIFQDIIRITPAGVLQAFAPGASVAPYSLTSSNAKIIGGPKWTKSRREYINRAILICGPDSGAFLSSETRTGDGTTNAWMVDYLGYTSPWTILVGGVYKNVGPGLEYTWDLTTTPYPTLRVGTDPIPGVGVLIEYGYYVNYPFRHVVEDASAATNPKEAVYRLTDVTTRAAADVEGAAIIRKSLASGVSRTVTVRTRGGLVLPGDVITITVPERTLSGSWLITAVQIRSEVDHEFTYDLTCVEGIESKGSWQDWWRNRTGTGANGGTTTITGGAVAGVTGSGTAGTLPIFGASTVLTDSLIRQGTGTPEGVVTAPIASMFLRTDTGDVYRKATGSGNTGWVIFGGAGTGTINTLSKWVSTSTLGDSVLAEDSGNVMVGAHLLPTLTDTYDIGRYDKLWNQGYLAQLNAVLFALNTQTLFGGFSTIGYNAGSFAAAVGSADTTINFGTTMTPGHFVQVRAHDTGGASTAEFIQVGTLVSGTTYNVTRNLSGLGAKNWAQGVPFLVLGTTGTGRIDLLAFDGKPRIYFTEQGATYNTNTSRALIGNLNGYYGYATDIYGAAFGDPTGAWLKIDPTNGIRIGHNTTTKISLTAAGDASFAGSITSSSGLIGGWSIVPGLIRSEDSRVLLQSGSAGNAYIAVTDGAGNYAALITDATYSSYAGGSNPATAPWRVTWAGAITATNATITGNITATSGNVIGAIAAGSITSSHIAANTIVAGDIAAGTITATEIATGTITADKLNVTTLSAITGNIGTITSGSISGTTITAGGGAVTLDTNGISITAGTSGVNQVKWSGGAYIQENTSNILHLRGAGGVTLNTTSYSVGLINGNASYEPVAGAVKLGSAGVPWADLYVDLATDTGTSVSITASHRLVRESSSLRYKEHVKPWTLRF